MALETETAAFQKLLGTDLAGQDGKFATISGERLIGTYTSYQDALDAGYAAVGLQPFLVKQVTPFPVVANFTRDLGVCMLPAS